MNNPFFSKPLISSIISVTPRSKIPLTEFSNVFGESEIFRIEKATGIEKVSVAEKGKTSSDYCYEAAKNLLEIENISLSEIEGLVYVTETPDYIIPSTAPSLQDRLGISKNSINVDLRCSCSGFVYGLFQASLLIESGCCRNVLLLAGNTVSRLVNPKDRALLMVTGDAACAALVTKSSSDIQSCFSFYVDGGGKNSIIIPAGGSRVPIKHGETDVLQYDSDGNGHTLEDLTMDGMEVMLFAVQQGRNLINSVLASMKWTSQDVNLFAIHQANRMIVERIAKGIKADMSKVPVSVKETGNCGLASIPLTLCNTYKGVNKDLKKVVCCGFGSGLIAAAAALDLSYTNIIPTIDV